jgi:hypothetical protein
MRLGKLLDVSNQAGRSYLELTHGKLQLGFERHWLRQTVGEHFRQKPDRSICSRVYK